MLDARDAMVTQASSVSWVSMRGEAWTLLPPDAQHAPTDRVSWVRVALGTGRGQRGACRRGSRRVSSRARLRRNEMPDLYRVTVIARKARKLQLKLLPTGHASSVPIGPSFARMLIEETCAPGHAEYVEWLKAKQASDEAFGAQGAIANVEVVASPSAPWPTVRSSALPDDLEAQLDAVVLEIGVDEAGMLAHMKVGAEWLSTAFDELDDGTVFRGSADDVLAWKRPPKRRAPASAARPSTSAACRLLEQTSESVRIEIVTAAELPSLAPASWLRVLRDAYPGLDVHPELATKHIASVAIEDVRGARDARGTVLEWSAETSSLNARGVLRARYRIVARDRAWLTRGLDPSHPFATKVLDGWAFRSSPSDVALHAPPASTRSDVSDFEELLELGRTEGRETELQMLADGLRGTREVVPRALEEAGKLGHEAAPLADLVAACTGALEGTVAIAALECSARIGALSLAPAVALAALRLDGDVVAAANRALKMFALLPAWSR